MDMNLNIVNKEISYTGNDIKGWCEYQIKNSTEFSGEANKVYSKYFGQYADKKLAPRSDIHYFVWHEKDYKGFWEVHLERDTEKTQGKKGNK